MERGLHGENFYFSCLLLHKEVSLTLRHLRIETISICDLFFVKLFKCLIPDRMPTHPSMASISSLQNKRGFSCCATCVCFHERNPICCVVVLLPMVQNRVTAECEEQEQILGIFGGISKMQTRHLSSATSSLLPCM